MAIDTAAKRNSALKDLFGILIPSGTISAADRQTMVGDYKPSGGGPPPGGTGNNATVFTTNIVNDSMVITTRQLG